MKTGWEARLNLRYSREGARTVLCEKSHVGPLVVQKAFYPEGPSVCHSVILHPPGGVAAGDSLSIASTAGQDAHALLTTPGATKWYRSTGPIAEQSVTLSVATGGSLEWLPQENIMFDRAQVRMRHLVHLAEGARYIGWDITRLGRTASGERFAAGDFRSRTEVVQAGRRLWGHQAGRRPSGHQLDAFLKRLELFRSRLS